MLCAAMATAADPAPASTKPANSADDFLVVDCSLPGQVRQLGQRSVYLSARRAARLSAVECQIRGGEYVASDRADVRSALGVWLPRAEQKDIQAQLLVGEIYERGLGVAPDYQAAAQWYRQAAEAGNVRAQINLGHLYERGLGVPANFATALSWYRRAAGLTDTVELDPSAPAPIDHSGELARLEQQLAQQISVSAAQARELEQARKELDARQHALDSASQATAASRSAADEERRKLEQLTRELQQRESTLAEQRAENARLAKELTVVQSQVQQQREQLQSVTARLDTQTRQMANLQQPIAQKMLAGPQLVLIEPALTPTRDIVAVARVAADERQLVARVTAPAGLVSLTVNDRTATANDRGIFSDRIVLQDEQTPVRIVAVDQQGKRAELSFIMRNTVRAASAGATSPGRRVDDAPPPIRPSIAFGKYYALVIGNNEYQTLPDLTSPVADANALAELLRTRYRFQTTVLTNASRYQILSALNKLRESLTEKDNLLLYFAGHGELDEVNQRGNWLPVDAERDSTANWIPTTAITDILNIMRAKQVLVVVDSCYAGALTRSSVARLNAGMTAAEREHWLKTMASKRARTVLTSGGLAPVMDMGGGQHSVFAKALLDVLGANSDILDGQRLHREVAARVAFAAANMQFDQVPEYGPIRFAGHEAGEFFLVP
jgi:TPR repeat protein